VKRESATAAGSVEAGGALQAVGTPDRLRQCPILRLLFLIEGHDQGIATEFEHVAAGGVDGGNHGGEDCIKLPRQFFNPARAMASTRRRREAGETDDIGEQDCTGGTPEIWRFTADPETARHEAGGARRHSGGVHIASQRMMNNWMTCRTWSE
jgi:hypothetical protein